MAVKDKIYSFLKGDFLFNREALGQWKFLVYVVLLILLMITSGHRFDKKVMEIADLNKRSKEMRALFIATRSEAVKLKLETTIRNRVSKREVFPSEEPPFLIEVKHIEK